MFHDPVAVPANSEILRHLPGADFHDCHGMALADEEAGITAMELGLQIFLRTPAWVDFLMGLRNRLVARLGLKNLGALSAVDRAKAAGDYVVGDRVGIFSLRYVSPEEVILGDSDRHLDVLVSVRKFSRDGRPWVAVTTVVHVHNRLGHVYMFFVRPAHRLIAPATLRNRSR